VDKLLNKRYAALYPSVFVTYRRDTGGAWRGSERDGRSCHLRPCARHSKVPSFICNTWLPADDSPSKVWPISPDTTVTDVQPAHYNLRHKHTSTLMAVARGEHGLCAGACVGWAPIAAPLWLPGLRAHKLLAFSLNLGFFNPNFKSEFLPCPAPPASLSPPLAPLPPL
jgi:hypothetical protein